MSGQNIRKPYEKKLREWETQTREIGDFVHELWDVNIINWGLCLLLNQHKISEKREQLEKIKAGVRKMTETLSLAMSDNSPNNDFDNYLERIIDLRLRINRLINQLSKKDVVKYLRSIVNDDE